MTNDAFVAFLVGIVVGLVLGIIIAAVMSAINNNSMRADDPER